MLILGIETATQKVSCALGGHEGVLGLFEVARGRRHAESLTPAIEFVCGQADVTLGELGAIAVDVGPGLFTGMRVGIATAKAMAHALRVPVIPVASLDLLALPLRYADRLIAAVIDARRSEVYYAFYRQVPGGVQRLEPPAVGPVGDLVGELLATGEEALLVGDGALRYREQIERGPPPDRVRRAVAGPAERRAAGAAGPRPRPAGGVGATRRGAAALPAAAGRRDQLGHPGVGPEVGLVKILPERPSSPSDDLVVRISRMRRRHVRTILKIEQQVYPRPWSAAVFASEIDQIPRTRRYLVAHVGRRLVGYGGLMLAPDSAHVTNIAVDPLQQRAGVGTRLLLALARDAIAMAAPALTLEVRVGNVAAHPAVRALRLRAGGDPQAVLRGSGRRHRHVGPRHRSARLRRPPPRHRGRASAAPRCGRTNRQ